MKHKKGLNGGVDTVTIGNKICDSILQDLLNDAASDVFGVCDSYLYYLHTI